MERGADEPGRDADVVIIRLFAAAESVGTPYLVGKPYTFEAILGVVARAHEERSPPVPSRVTP
jgi:hypothetical protein